MFQSFKYLGCMFDESDTFGAVCWSKLVIGRKVASVIRSLVNAWSSMKVWLCLF